jgi:L-alanine-DL-glutamate epimerase-like enolase superfamily enzyme
MPGVAMRITDVHAVQPRTPADPPETDWRTALGQILVIVETDAGVRGTGVGGGGAAGIHVVGSILRTLVVGAGVEDVPDIERLWQRMYRATVPYGRKGLAIMAISGVDLALWDALGKLRGMSVAGLLGGPKRTRMPCYATTGQPVEAVARGFGAVKLSVGSVGVDEAIARVAQTRAAIGTNVRLFTDASGQWDREQSLRAAEAFAAHDVGWLEEPLPADDLAGYADLARRSPVPIAGGEHEYTVYGFRELAAHRAHAIWQPDVCWTGGLTQLRAIYALAAASGVRVVPHRGSEVWALHAIAALDPQPLAESGRPWMTWVRGQPPIAGGEIAVPDRPGFGVEVDTNMERV